MFVSQGHVRTYCRWYRHLLIFLPCTTQQWNCPCSCKLPLLSGWNSFHKYPLFWGFRSLKSVSYDFTIFLLPVTSHSTLLYMCDSCDIIELHIKVCSSKRRHLSISTQMLSHKCLCVSRFKPSQKLSTCSLFIHGLWKGFLSLCLFVVWSPILFLTYMYFSWLKFKSELENKRPSAKNLVRYWCIHFCL